MQRETGYYWVKYDGNTIMAFWNQNLWIMVGYNGYYKETDFEKVSDRILEPKW